MRSNPQSRSSLRPCSFVFLAWALGLLLAGTLIGGVLLATALSAHAAPLRADPTFNACGCLVETPAGVPGGSFRTPGGYEIAELAGLFPFGAPSNCPSVKMGPIIGGFLGGAATGALIGSRGDRWRKIYP